MKTISIHQFCTYHNISQDFINSLYEFELIDLVEIKTEKHIPEKDIDRIEKLLRIHHDLGVNLEGLEVINNLLNQIGLLQEEIDALKNQIDFYKP